MLFIVSLHIVLFYSFFFKKDQFLVSKKHYLIIHFFLQHIINALPNIIIIKINKFLYYFLINKSIQLN